MKSITKESMMKAILRLLALLLPLLPLEVVADPLACTVQTQAAAIAPFSDLVGNNAITPANVRNVICSKGGLIDNNVWGGTNTFGGNTTFNGGTNFQGVASFNGGLPNGQLSPAPANSIKGNNTAGPTTPTDLTVAQVDALLTIPLYTTVTKTANYTILPADIGKAFNSSTSNNIVFTLPAANSVAAGATLWISSPAGITGTTITAAGSDLILSPVGSNASVVLQRGGEAVGLQSNGTTRWRVINATASSLLAPPQITTFTSNGTYTTPTGALWLDVEIWGGGGGAAASGTGPGSATAGTATTFGSSFLTANGGAAGSGTTGGAGGTVTAGCDESWPGETAGNASASTAQNVYGNAGGSAVRMGSRGASGATTGGNGLPNTGAGGGGAGDTTVVQDAAGGGGGAYCRKYISAPAASYPVVIGPGGTGASAGTGGFAGGNGGSGYARVVAYFQ